MPRDWRIIDTHMLCPRSIAVGTIILPSNPWCLSSLSGEGGQPKAFPCGVKMKAGCGQAEAVNTLRATAHMPSYDNPCNSGHLLARPARRLNTILLFLKANGVSAGNAIQEAVRSAPQERDKVEQHVAMRLLPRGYYHL